MLQMVMRYPAALVFLSFVQGHNGGTTIKSVKFEWKMHLNVWFLALIWKKKKNHMIKLNLMKHLWIFVWNSQKHVQVTQKLK